MATPGCPVLLISAPSSGQGKTTLTAFLARYLVNQGKGVRVFKMGPDYLDPQVLACASGTPVVQLDIWMAGRSWCAQQLALAAQDADCILIEGAMGLFDGSPSSADFAIEFGIPIVLVLDVKGMAQTVAALAHGLAHYDRRISCVGVFANKCGSVRHRELIETALPAELPILGSIARDPELALPERHLGLVQAGEIGESLELILDRGAAALANATLERFCLNALLNRGSNRGLNKGGPTPSFEAWFDKPEPTLSCVFSPGYRIAIARDPAFSFIYQANLDLLEQLGAELVYFSPLEQEQLPQPVHALWLPGGYPELHAQVLASNETMRTSIREHFRQDKPILAECGGFLYTLDRLIDLQGVPHTLLGLIEGESRMSGRSGCQGLQTAELPEGEIRGHAHHRSRAQCRLEPLGYARRQRHDAPGEAIYRSRGLTATYLHLFFPRNPMAILGLFEPQQFNALCGKKVTSTAHLLEQA